MKGMQAKTIRQALRSKFSKFLESIEDETVRNLVRKNSMITGGAIASMLSGEPVNDYDVYFTNAETVRAVCNYYIHQFNKTNETHDFELIDGTRPASEHQLGDPWYLSNVTVGRIKIRVISDGVAVADDFEFSDEPEKVEEAEPEPVETKKLYRPVYISANAITLSNDFQLIIRFFGTPNMIHENYDFTHCTCCWTSSHGELSLPSKALECLLSKTLHYQGSKYPLASIIRTRKFITRGFKINAGQYLKMCLQLNDLNLKDLAVLEDQLTGVDAAYFAQMLQYVNTDSLANDVDNTYLITLIDRFF